MSEINKLKIGFTHSSYEEGRNSTGPHPLYLRSTVMRKCTRYFHLSYVSLYRKDTDHAQAKFELLDSMNMKDDEEENNEKTTCLYRFYNFDS